MNYLVHHRKYWLFYVLWIYIIRFWTFNSFHLLFIEFSSLNDIRSDTVEIKTIQKSRSTSNCEDIQYHWHQRWRTTKCFDGNNRNKLPKNICVNLRAFSALGYIPETCRSQGHIPKHGKIDRSRWMSNRSSENKKWEFIRNFTSTVMFWLHINFTSILQLRFAAVGGCEDVVKTTQ